MKDDASLTPAFQKKDDTGKILGRLVTYMAGGEAKGRFIIALIMRISGLIGLILLPTFTGQAINVASDPNGSVAELQMWILYAFIAGIVYLTLSWFAERYSQIWRQKDCLSCKQRYSTTCRHCH